MERIGVHYYNARGLLERAADCRRVRVEGIYSHFANADALDLSSARLQLSRFLEVLEWVRQAGVVTPPVPPHGQLRRGCSSFGRSHLDLVRPGILLYGVYPSIEVASDHSGRAGAGAALARGVLQGRHAWASGELRLHVAVRPPGAGGHGAGGLRRRLLPRALQRGPRADPRPASTRWWGASAWTRSWSTSSGRTAYNGDVVTLLGIRRRRAHHLRAPGRMGRPPSPTRFLTNLNTRIPRVYV